MIIDDRVTLFNTFTLDLARGCVLDGGRPIHLRRQSYEVLKYLVENRGHLISKDQLIAEIWQGRFHPVHRLIKHVVVGGSQTFFVVFQHPNIRQDLHEG